MTDGREESEGNSTGWLVHGSRCMARGGGGMGAPPSFTEVFANQAKSKVHVGPPPPVEMHLILLFR